MHVIIMLLAIFGLVFALKETEGPWGVMSWMRHKLFSCKLLGTLFFKLLDCFFCTGFWCGIAVYLLATEHIKLTWIPIWGLAGASISLILSAVLDRLHRE